MEDGKKIRRMISQGVRYCLLAWAGIFSGTMVAQTQKVVFSRDFSPAEGLVIPQEKPYRDEVSLNGLWDLQCVAVPASWKSGSGIAPELAAPQPDQWEKVKIKIPSAISVNDWGRGSKVGEGTQRPYTPSSVYFPSYPEHWVRARMGWLCRNFRIPADWEQKRVLLHFEAVAGDCVIWVNGKEVCHNFDAHLPFEADVTEYVNRDGENELLVGVRDTKLFDQSHPVYKKMGATYPTGSNTDYLLGIWQDVYLFAVPEIRITDVFVQSWLDKNELKVEVELTNLSSKKANITLIGDSAGGNLCAALSLMARDCGEFMPKRQILIYAVSYNDYKDISPFPSVRVIGSDYLLRAGKMQDYIDLYARNEEDKKNPYFAPYIAEDLANQPDTLILTCEFDPLRDEGEAYGKRLKEAGNYVEIHRIKDALHGYFALGIKQLHVQESFTYINEFLKEETL